MASRPSSPRRDSILFSPEPPFIVGSQVFARLDRGARRGKLREMKVLKSGVGFDVPLFFLSFFQESLF